MTDPFAPAARHIAKECFTDIRASIDGLPGEALDWKPAADTNSAAVLVTHVMNSTRSWISVAVGAPLPDRDRDSEFLAKSDDVQALLTWFDDMASQIDGLLRSANDVDWAAIRNTHTRPGEKSEEVPAAWALIHAIGHLREHVAHVGLTRQLWDAR